MGVPMPAVVVLFICKTAIVGPPDQNAAATGWQDREWKTEHNQMICFRKEIALWDAAAAQGALEQPFNQNICNRVGVQMGATYDATHSRSNYRFWRVACPVPVVDTRTGEVVAWRIPDCGISGTVRCESDITL